MSEIPESSWFNTPILYHWAPNRLTRFSLACQTLPFHRRFGKADTHAKRAQVNTRCGEKGQVEEVWVGDNFIALIPDISLLFLQFFFSLLYFLQPFFGIVRRVRRLRTSPLLKVS
jgi:hypothetical protein